MKTLRRLGDLLLPHRAGRSADLSPVAGKVGSYLRDLRKLLDTFGYACGLYGHFGRGCIRTLARMSKS